MRADSASTEDSPRTGTCSREPSEPDRQTATIDPDGVAPAGIQALDARTCAQQSHELTLEQRPRALERENAELKQRLQRIEEPLRQVQCQKRR